jgi:FkbM family methyltransferase
MKEDRKMEIGQDAQLHRQAGILRRLQRKILASTSSFLPTSPTLKQINLGDLKVLAWINDHIGRRLLLARSYEPDDIAALKKIVRHGDVIADVGANIGYISLHFAKFSGPTGRVFAFEPMSYLHPVVTLNAHLNDFETISVHPLVVSETSGGRAIVNIPSGGGGAPLAYFTPSDSGDGEITVRLDEFASDAAVNRFDIIKIDVEGGEVNVLKGASALLQSPERRPRVLMIEIVDGQLQRFGYRISDVYDILLPLGYKAYIYRAEKSGFEAVSDPINADCWNVFFSTEQLTAL